MASNFDFLEKAFPEYPEYVEWGRAAEEKMYTVPADALTDIGRLCENYTQWLCDYHGIELSEKDNTAAGREKALLNNDIITANQKSDLRRIRIARNLATHEGRGTTKDCREVIPKAYSFSVWFANNYGKGKWKKEYSLPLNKPKKKNKQKEQEKEKREWGKAILAFCITVVAGMAVFGFIQGLFGIEQGNTSKQEQIDQIKQMIVDGQFDLAEGQINKLWPESDYIYDIDSGKESNREALQKELEEAKAKASNTTVPSVAVSRSSSSFQGDNYIDVAQELFDSGFICVHAKKAEKKPGLFHKDQTVMRVSIDGDIEFDGGDLYRKTASVKIYYYSEY